MENKNEKWLAFWYEVRDMLLGAAFPLMLQIILSVTFIGMTSSLISTEDIALSVVMLVIGELFLAGSYVVFGRQNGITSVRKILNHDKKVEIGSKDREAVFGTGEYSAYKGFAIGFISCVPYIIVQIIQCAFPNTFCDFLIRYAFGWASIPLSFVNGISQWLNLLFVLFPVIVHGVAYLIFAHREWNKLQTAQERWKSVSGGK